MRTFELIVLILLMIFFIIRFTPLKNIILTKINYLVIMIILFIFIHLFFEGFRWSFLPSFFLLGIILISIILSKQTSTILKNRNKLKIIIKILVLIILALSIALPNLFPVFKLEKPQGHYSVGCTTFTLIDKNREELFTEKKDDFRKFSVKAWYPTDVKLDMNTDSYWHKTYGPLLANDFKMPSFLFDQINYVNTNSYPDIPISSELETYPILIFSHGYGGFIGQNTTQMEELASNGYIVFSIAHTYEAVAVDFSDGTIITSNKEIQDKFTKDIDSNLLEEIMECKNTSKKDNLLKKFLNGNPTMSKSLDVWTNDTIYLIDNLEVMNKTNTKFKDKLDITKLGIFGMSFGGVTAAQVCYIDDRCKAGINMDGMQVGDLVNNSLSKPFMFMNSDQGAEMGYNNLIYENSLSKAYSVTISGSTHLNYSDFGYFSPLFKLLGVTGKINTKRMAQILNEYILAFFNKHLNGNPEPLLDGKSKNYPEVKIKIRN